VQVFIIPARHASSSLQSPIKEEIALGSKWNDKSIFSSDVYPSTEMLESTLELPGKVSIIP
jgi:hypothetical protein